MTKDEKIKKIREAEVFIVIWEMYFREGMVELFEDLGTTTHGGTERNGWTFMDACDYILTYMEKNDISDISEVMSIIDERYSQESSWDYHPLDMLEIINGEGNKENIDFHEKGVTAQSFKRDKEMKNK